MHFSLAATSTLLLVPLLTAASSSNATLDEMRLTRRDQNLPYRVGDLTKQLMKGVRPYVRFELSATANDDLTLVMDIKDCAVLGYSSNRVRVWANQRNAPVNPNGIRLCQHFQLASQVRRSNLRDDSKLSPPLSSYTKVQTLLLLV